MIHFVFFIIIISIFLSKSQKSPTFHPNLNPSLRDLNGKYADWRDWSETEAVADFMGSADGQSPEYIGRQVGGTVTDKKDGINLNVNSGIAACGEAVGP